MVRALGIASIEAQFLANLCGGKHDIVMAGFKGSDHDEVVRHGIRLDHAEDSITGIRRDFVSKIEHAPVKAIAFGIASIFLTACGVALVGIIFSKAS